MDERGQTMIKTTKNELRNKFDTWSNLEYYQYCSVHLQNAVLSDEFIYAKQFAKWIDELDFEDYCKNVLED